MTTNTEAITVGRFTLNADGTLSGPAQYLTDQGNELIDRIVAGTDTVFNMSQHLSPSVEIAILVRLQTDFAGWRGHQQMLGWLKS